MSTLLESISKLRKSRGFTQIELASQSGISLATLQNIEAGKANPSLETLEAIFAVIGADLVALERKIDWNLLAYLGVPLIVTGDVPNWAPQKVILLKTINALSVEEDLEDRNLNALVGFLSAIHDHYPSVFGKINKSLRNLFEQRKNSVDPKLRRMALSRISEYL